MSETSLLFAVAKGSAFPNKSDRPRPRRTVTWPWVSLIWFFGQRSVTVDGMKPLMGP